MGKAQATNVVGSQELGSMDTVLQRMISHVSTNQDLVHVVDLIPAMMDKPEMLERIAQIFKRVPGRLETELEDLRTVSAQVAQLRELATKKGYGDVLELLDQKLPYNRGYVL